MCRTDGSDVEYCFITGGTDPKPVTNCYFGDSFTTAALGDTTVDTAETTSDSGESEITTANPENATSTNSGKHNCKWRKKLNRHKWYYCK
jgi:hypothetical protein